MFLTKMQLYYRLPLAAYVYYSSVGETAAFSLAVAANLYFYMRTIPRNRHHGLLTSHELYTFVLCNYVHSAVCKKGFF